MVDSVDQPKTQFEWPDWRYRFAFEFPAALIVGTVVAVVFLVANFSLGIIATVSIAAAGVVSGLLEPGHTPEVKHIVAQGIFGKHEQILSTELDFVWEKQTHRIEINNSSGDSTIRKKMELRSRSAKVEITNQTHDFGFSKGNFADNYTDQDGNPSPIKCTDENGDTLNHRSILKRDCNYEFITSFMTPVSSEESQIYNISLDTAEGVYPLSDQEDTWTFKLLTTAKTIEVVVSFQYPVNLGAVRAQNALTGNAAGSVERDQGANEVRATFSDLGPGSYTLTWGKTNN